jgi:uncharacterized protein
VRFVVESWPAEYGAPFEDHGDDEEGRAKVDVTIELPASRWQPLTPKATPARCIVFVDGVQQIDARVWTTGDEGVSRMGICVSLAAGTVRCDGVAQVDSIQVRRLAFGPAYLGEIDCGLGVAYCVAPVADLTPSALDTALRRRREDLEVEVAHAASGAELIVVDGHVRQRETISGAVGYLKSHQAQYLEPEQARVVGELRPGQRTPVFLLETPWSRYTWYQRLPGSEGHTWSGVVRCEASLSLGTAEVAAFADVVAATLPRFASQQHKDPRAPQNLYPIAGLERELRRRMGDRAFLLRLLQKASHSS